MELFIVFTTGPQSTTMKRSRRSMNVKYNEFILTLMIFQQGSLPAILFNRNTFVGNYIQKISELEQNSG